MLNYVHLKVSLAPLVIALLITLTASSWTATSDSAEELAITQPQVLTPLEVHYRTNLTIVEQLRHNHYVKKNSMILLRAKSSKNSSRAWIADALISPNKTSKNSKNFDTNWTTYLNEET